MDTKILLENGTNELEVLEFVLNGNAYGINVAKVKEIIPYQETVPVPQCRRCHQGAGRRPGTAPAHPRRAGSAGEPQRRPEVFSGPFRPFGPAVGGAGCFELRRSDVPLSGDVRHDACKLSVRYACVEQSSRTD